MSHILAGTLELATVAHEVRFVHIGDARTVAAITTTGQTPMAQASYLPFGTRIADHRMAPRGYAGKPEDASALLYSGARSYAPSLGRFTAPDSAISPTTSTYAYAVNAPFTYTDRDGRRLELIGTPDDQTRIAADLSQIAGVPVARILEGGRAFARLADMAPTPHFWGWTLVNYVITQPDIIQLHLASAHAPPRFTVRRVDSADPPSNDAGLTYEWRISDAPEAAGDATMFIPPTQTRTSTATTWSIHILSGLPEIYYVPTPYWLTMHPPKAPDTGRQRLTLHAAKEQPDTQVWEEPPYALAHELGHALGYMLNDPAWEDPHTPTTTPWSPDDPYRYGAGLAWENRIRLENGAPIRPRY